MAKKLILLLLIIPIVVMILLFAASQTVANLVDMHVDNIEIIGDSEFVYLDLDSREAYTLEYVVTPTGAKNKDIYISTTEYGEAPLATFNFEVQDGKVIITPLTAGSAVVTLTTVDRAKYDTVTIHVTSKKLQAIESTISSSVLTLGGDDGKDTAQITTTFLPQNPSNTVLYYIVPEEGKNVVSVSEDGLVRAVGYGQTTITVVSAADESITDTVDVAVELAGTMALSDKNVSTSEGEGSIVVSIVSPEALTQDKLTYKFFDEDGNEIPNSNGIIEAWIEIDGEADSNGVRKAALKFRFVDKDFVGDVTIEVTLTLGEETVTQSCKISKVDSIDAHFNKDKTVGLLVGQTSSLSFTLTPSDAKVTYGEPKYPTDLLNVVRTGNTLIVTAKDKLGVAEIEITIFNKLDDSDSVTIKATVEIGPEQIDIKGVSGPYGYENLFTLGRYKYNGVDANGLPKLTDVNVHALGFQLSTTAGGYDYAKNIEWYSSSDKVTINPQTGTISFADDAAEVEVVDFRVRYHYGDQVLESKAPFKIRCVKNGINVYNYADLYSATKATDYSIVLQNNVVEDFGYINGAYVLESQGLYQTIHTTYDDTYYENIGRENEATVKILLEFRNDLYGNGYAISANNVTHKLGEMENSVRPEGTLFQGPLDFVKLDQGAANYASVKAQDNICFALYEGVTVTNVELRGYDFKDTSSGSLDLRELNWVGTTVEVFGDNVTIAYSTLINGRTVLRAFGDINDPTKDSHLTVTNSILAQAREFIMRIGSNQFIDGKDPVGNNAFTPESIPFPNTEAYQSKYNVSKLPFNKSNAYGFDVKKKYYQYTQEQKNAYDEAFINTFVTVKDSAFQDSGIFAIGMDSHFAGNMLHRGQSVFPGTAGIDPWHDLAKTSYGAKLTFEGTVRLYNWKKLNDVDSTTLIETAGNWGPKGANDMTLYLKDMLDNVQKDGKYPYITTDYNGEKYVHAGIAFFGGGKNYCVFDSTSEIVAELSTYDISLSDSGRGELDMAAGNEKFYFFIYDKDPTKTNAFTPEDQERILASEGAYDFIKR